RFGVPVYGTMAHSFVQAHADEREAFAHFAADDPEHAVHLLDTYDTEAAAAKVVALAREGVAVRGVRLDSGDLAEHARRVRRILDAGGLGEVTIFASGNLDEDALRDLIASGAPIDGFGLGTRLVTAADAPYLDCAYKLVEYAGRPRRKRSEGKASWPGRKQVWRRHGDDGRIREDVLTLEDDPQAGTPLLVPVMQAGRRVGLSPSLAASRAHAAHARAWAARTPADFAFGVKAHAALTQHPLEPARLDRDLLGELPRELCRKRSIYANELPEAVLGELWRRFHVALAPLRAAGKLAYLLFQMPKWFMPSRASEAYLERVPARLPGAPIAVEFREARWM